MRDQETDRGGMPYQSLVDLPLNRSRSSQLSCLGSGIPSLVGGWFRFEGYKMWCGFISLDQFRFKGRVIEGTQTLDLFSMAGGLFRIKSVLGGRRIGSRGDAYASSLSIGFPPFAVSGEGDKGEAPNMFYPQPPSVISNLNPLFLFTSTLRATTSSPFTSKGKR
uniref:Uncharacterized protein n=1 Tax=Zelkova schneideriana TaxID=172643 RepID=A0A8F1N7K6_9ROSA|nr:hypothetical protein [Zelkova schneideriana]